MKLKIFTLLSIALMLFLSASTAFAVCSSNPAGKALSAPYGLNVQGEASGTKLSGVIEISLTGFYCETGSDYQVAYGLCPEFVPGTTDSQGNPVEAPGVFLNGVEIYPNAAMARAAMRLSMTKKNGESVMHTFYVDLGPTPYNFPGDIQALALAKLREPILKAFFGGDTGQRIYLKDFSLLSQSNIEGADPASIYADFAIVANLILAVN